MEHGTKIEFLDISNPERHEGCGTAILITRVVYLNKLPGGFVRLF
jgi:hypothetical protein